MKYFKSPYFKFILKLLFTIVALYVVFKNVPIDSVAITILNSRMEWLLIAMAFFILSKYFSSIRLHQYFTHSTIIIESWYNMKLYLIGMFYNLFLPTGVGGDAYKVIKINAEYSYPIKRIASAVLFDRISGLVALINITALLSLFYTNISQSIVLIITLVVGNILYQLIVQKLVSKHFITVKSELLSWLVQLSQCVCAFCILKSIEMESNHLIYIIIFLISSVASLLPLSIGGLGAREYTFMIAATHFQLNIEKAISIGFIFYSLSLFVSLFGLYFIFNPISALKKHV